MTYDSLRALVAETKQHLLQEYSLDSLLSCDKATFDFFKNSYKTPQVVIPTPKPQIAPQIAPITQPKPKPVSPKPAIPKPQIIAPPTDILPTVTPTNPSLFALPRPLTYASEPQLQDIGQKLSQESIPTPKNSPTPIWKEHYPCCAIVSFFSDNSFYQKMAQAITERLHINSILLTPSLETTASLIAYTCTLDCIIIAYDQTLIPKAKNWLSELPELETVSKDISPFTCKSALYAKPIYELQLQENPSAEEKSILWKALQHLLIASVK